MKFLTVRSAFDADAQQLERARVEVPAARWADVSEKDFWCKLVEQVEVRLRHQRKHDAIVAPSLSAFGRTRRRTVGSIPSNTVCIASGTWEGKRTQRQPATNSTSLIVVTSGGPQRKNFLPPAHLFSLVRAILSSGNEESGRLRRMDRSVV